jgi:hypothetical protein
LRRGRDATDGADRATRERADRGAAAATGDAAEGRASARAE